MVPANEERTLIDENKAVDSVLLELLVVSCDGAAGDILQFEMMQPTGRSAWLRIQTRYAGSSSLKIGALYVEFFRPVTIVEKEGSMAAINRW